MLGGGIPKGFGGDRKAPEIGREACFDIILALSVKQAKKLAARAKLTYTAAISSRLFRGAFRSPPVPPSVCASPPQPPIYPTVGAKVKSQFYSILFIFPDLKPPRSRAV